MQQHSNTIENYWSLSQGERAKVRKEIMKISGWSKTYEKSFLPRLKQKKNVTENELSFLARAIENVSNRALITEIKIENSEKIVLCTKEEIIAAKVEYNKLTTPQRVDLKENLCITIDDIDFYAH